jgi:hypothetical protein
LTLELNAHSGQRWHSFLECYDSKVMRARGLLEKDHIAMIGTIDFVLGSVDR